MQRIFGMAISDGVKSVQKSIDTLSTTKINDPVLCDKIKAFTDADEETKNAIRSEAEADGVDIVVAILRSGYFSPELPPEQIGRVFNAYVAWNNAVENVCSPQTETIVIETSLILQSRLMKKCGRAPSFSPI